MSLDCPIEEGSTRGGSGDTSYSTFHSSNKRTYSGSGEVCSASNKGTVSDSGVKATIGNNGNSMLWVPKKYASKKRLLLRALHALYGALSYVLALFCMLIAGTMNPALFLCLCLGYALGDFLFGEINVTEGVSTVAVSNLTETEAQLELKRRELKRVASDQRDDIVLDGSGGDGGSGGDEDGDLGLRDDTSSRGDGSTKLE